MALSETIKSGMYRVWDSANSTWNRYAFWTKGNQVECEDGNTVEDKIGDINGLTASTNVTVAGMAADATAVKNLTDSVTQLNSDLSNVANRCIHVANGANGLHAVNIYIKARGVNHVLFSDGANNALIIISDFSLLTTSLSALTTIDLKTKSGISSIQGSKVSGRADGATHRFKVTYTANTPPINALSIDGLIDFTAVEIATS